MPTQSKLFSTPIRWAGGFSIRLTDTCPLDNFLAMLFVVVRDENPGLVRTLMESDIRAESTLGRALAEMQSDHVGKAKDTWASFLLDRKAGVTWKDDGLLSLYGGLVEMFIFFFRETYGVSYVSECSNGPAACPNYSFTSQSRAILKIRSPLSGCMNDTQSQLDRCLNDGAQDQCNIPIPCWKLADAAFLKEYTRIADVYMGLDDSDTVTPAPERVCCGMRTMKQLHLPDRCWFLPIDISKVSNDELFCLAYEIVVSGKLFRLRGIVLFNRFMKHFYSWIRKGVQWYRYCGMFDAEGSLVKRVIDADGEPHIAIYSV